MSIFGFWRNVRHTAQVQGSVQPWSLIKTVLRPVYEKDASQDETGCDDVTAELACTVVGSTKTVHCNCVVHSEYLDMIAKQAV
jgi:hypothetical protein